jgi:hypothetical protein
MKVIGLCKANSCNEFIEAALESVYDYVDGIVFSNSNYNWLGEYKQNEVLPVVDNWQKKHDNKNKIHHVNVDVCSQRDQENIGYKYIQENFNPDWIWIFDSDEVWQTEQFLRLKHVAEKAHMYNSIHAKMKTFIKSPFYMVDPPEMCKPAVLIRPIFNYLNGTRGNNVKPFYLDNDLYFNHYSYVRKKEIDVFSKIYTTLKGDQEDVKQSSLVDIEKWKREKWNKLPHATDFHTTKGYEKSWHKIKVVGMEHVPETLRNKDIIKQFNLK